MTDQTAAAGSVTAPGASDAQPNVPPNRTTLRVAGSVAC